uniref:NAC transcription factor 32 n=1 Tax=Haloxylon ammodendron TaxID=151230 RepID=A0A1B2RWD4_9CARY|nr:NAC transcription factor 32 [Haloxylon ammodendron]
MGRNSSTSLAPGFRFHPTDEELVWYYLRRKVYGKPFRVDAISEIDIYKVEPSDLPGLSKLKTRDLEWYFFSALDRKYGNGSKTNRATNEGYWKTTGKDRPVYHNSKVVGMKKTLVYHRGRAPRGLRTNWVMHEYKLSDEVIEKASFPAGFVLCRVFQKSGTGPKNGEKYGAPLVEEEWEDDHAEVEVPATEVSFEDPYVDDDDAYIEQSDLDQVLDIELSENVPLPVSFDHVDSNNYLEDSLERSGNDQKPVIEESEDNCRLQAFDVQKFHDPLHDASNACVVKNEHMAQPDDLSNEAPVNLLDDLFSGNAPPDDGLFPNAADFLEQGQDPHDFDFLESYMEDDIDIGPYLNLDSLPELMSNDSDHVFSTNQNVFDATWQIPSTSQQPPRTGDDDVASSSGQVMEVSKTKPSKTCDDDIASSSDQVMEVSKARPSKTDFKYPFLASHLLGNIPAPSAFASELPSKDMAARLSSAVHSSSSSVHVTAGMIRIRDMPVGVSGSGLHWSFDKTGNISVVLSFDLPQVSLVESLTGLLSSKVSTAAYRRGWLCSMLFLVFVLGVSIKIGTCIYAK